MLHINTVHVQRETLWVKQLAGEQYKMICSGAWACKHTYIAEFFVGLCTHSSVWKVSSAHRGVCVTTGGLYRPTHLCVAHFELHKKKSQTVFFFFFFFFFDVSVSHILSLFPSAFCLLFVCVCVQCGFSSSFWNAGPIRTSHLRLQLGGFRTAR